MFSILFTKEECTHERITPDVDSAYCPDCGEYVENQWFLSRCECCGIKQKTIILKDKISTSTKFCRNCGSHSFVVEKIKKINFIDINYAIVIKKVCNNNKTCFTQSWAEPEEIKKPKLLTNNS